MHAIDYDPIVKEIIKASQKVLLSFYLPLVPAENGNILHHIQKNLFAINQP